ncbi:hypothetical protein [Aestuariivivens sediminis]|uniref:hypothetical protein n=1 Tax=Aestuariivivens sediminis TaxID=2913557 RepID=UPI001F581DA8|nr:hypothetical protein [Aestuariivivens sediminis]
MKSHFELTDQEFEKYFALCKLDPSLFNHEAHLRLAWIHISKYGLIQAEQNIMNQLKAFVGSLNEKDKFNTTLTIAAIKMVYHFMCKSNSDNFKNFVMEFPRLNSNFKELVASHYGFDIFNSQIAKEHYLTPDLKPF